MSEIFQSTPSTRRETSQIRTTGNGISHFNPLPPHGGRQHGSPSMRREWIISIHSLHTEGDTMCLDFHGKLLTFQSTPSTRRETNCAVFRRFLLSLFQSTPSTRRETAASYLPPHEGEFQSTPSTRRETVPEYRMRRIPPFQSTPSTRRETVL